MKCTECGNAMTKSVGDHVYRESGMDHVILRGVTKYTCETCGAERVSILAIDSLHRTLALAIANKPTRLIPSEVRFLRDYLDLSNKEFAELMGVSPEQASRWTTTDNVGVPAERFLRVLVVMGPDALAARSAASGEMPVVSIETAELVRTLKHLPPPSSAPSDAPIRLRRQSSHWMSEATCN